MYSAVHTKHRMPLFQIFLMLAGLCIMLAGCSLKGKEPDPNVLIKARLEEERGKISLERQEAEKNHIHLAKELMAKQHYEVALVQLKSAMKRNGRDPEIHHLIGVCHREMHEPEEAVKSFSRAIELDEDFSCAYDGLGLTYAMTGRLEKARELFLTAISLNPARADFYNNIGFLEMKSGHYKKAERYFRKSLAVNRDFKRAGNNLAVCLGLSGNDTEAMDLLTGYYPRSLAFKNMGIIYQMKGENEKAEAMFKQAAAGTVPRKADKKPETDDKKNPENAQEIGGGGNAQKVKEKNPVRSASDEFTGKPPKTLDWTRVEVAHWNIIDEGDREGPSSWYISREILKQQSNIHGGSDIRDIADKPGTYAIAGESLWADYCLDVDMLSNDDDALGVIFRYLDNDHYYRFSMDSSRKYRRLVKKINGRTHVLAEENEGYEKGRRYRIRTVAVKDRLQIYLDEKLLFDVRDPSITMGKIGVYCWGNRGSQFRYPMVRLYPAEKLNDRDIGTPAFTKSHIQQGEMK